MNETFLNALLALSTNHVTTSFVERVDLLRRQIEGYALEVAHNLIDEGFGLAWLMGYKVSTAFVGDFDKSVASHVLDAFVCLVHELEKLVDNRLEELPMGLEESGILADNVHDVAGHDGLVVFAALHLGKA
jgi:hypothetical protein